MVGPLECLLYIGIDELTKKSTVKRGVLANKNSLSPGNIGLSKRRLDEISHFLRIHPLFDILPFEPVHFKAMGVALLPFFTWMAYGGFERFTHLSSTKIDDLIGNFYNFMPLRIEPVCFYIKKNA